MSTDQPSDAATPASEPAAAAPEAAPASERKDILKTPPVEAKEMGALISRGLTAHSVVGFLTFVGIALLIAGLLYFRFDRLPGERRFGGKDGVLDQWVRNQVDMDQRTYKRVPTETVQIPGWPLMFYRKLRNDIFLLAALVLLLALVFLYIEKAKMRRNDVLVYRALAREIEKLRLRIKRMEAGKPSSGPDKSPAASPDGDEHA